MNTATQDIRWRAVTSLIFLDLAILISWLAYHEYQPELLKQFGMADMAFPLSILQGIILFITPPIAGLAADRLARKGSNRLPVVTTGINFVSMVFMVVAVTIIAQNPSPFLKLLFPVMVALWLIAMNIFHSPAVSTLETFVPADKMPLVIALFAILANIIAATEPVLVDLINVFGAPVTFAVGGALVFGTGFWFSRAAKQLVAQADSAPAQAAAQQSSSFALVFVLGLLVGGLTTCIYKLFPLWIAADTELSAMIGMEPTWFVSILICVAAVLSYPMGMLAGRVGTRRLAMAAGIVGALTISTLQWVHGTPRLLLFCLFPLPFAAATVTYLPIAFTRLEKRHLVLGIGVFFSGVELTASLVDIMQIYLQGK